MPVQTGTGQHERVADPEPGEGLRAQGEAAGRQTETESGALGEEHFRDSDTFRGRLHTSDIRVRSQTSDADAQRPQEGAVGCEREGGRKEDGGQRDGDETEPSDATEAQQQRGCSAKDAEEEARNEERAQRLAATLPEAAPPVP